MCRALMSILVCWQICHMRWELNQARVLSKHLVAQIGLRANQ
jgi:hypothetical protein